MAFTRRIGELWEPFCLLCWQYAIDETLNYFAPPLFSEVKQKLTQEIQELINSLEIDKKQQIALMNSYDKVWQLVTAREIKLELDLHFQKDASKFVVDFKSGFGSNEKGNTNRLLLVASAYKILAEGHQCIIFVRSPEAENNYYLQILKKSGLWSVYCGAETYGKIEEYTGFNLARWQQENLNWEQDFEPGMYNHLQSNQLVEYLQW